MVSCAQRSKRDTNDPKHQSLGDPPDISNNFDATHDITERQSEHNAYSVTNDVLKEAGRSMANGVDLSTPAGIDQFLHDQQPGMNLDVPISTNTEP
jgi:hypothetical protein